MTRSQILPANHRLAPQQPALSRWQPLLMMAKAVYGAQLWLAVLWLLAAISWLTGLLLQSGLPLVLGCATLCALQLSVPIQLNQLSNRKSWLLLPNFKQLVLQLLLLKLLFWLATVSILLLFSTLPVLNILMLVATIYSLIVLPCLYVRHLWPLAVEFILLLIAMKQQHLLQQALLWVDHQPLLLLVPLLALVLLWWAFARYWLNPQQQAKVQHVQISSYRLYYTTNYLPSLSKKAVSLARSWLMADGDSWPAMLMRATTNVWFLPLTYFAIELLFNLTSDHKLFPIDPFYQLMVLILPMVTLYNTLLKTNLRSRTAWLLSPVSRAGMFGWIELAHWREFAAYLLVTLGTAMLLFPAWSLCWQFPVVFAFGVLNLYLSFLLAAVHPMVKTLTPILLTTAVYLSGRYTWEQPLHAAGLTLLLLLPVYPLRRYAKNYWATLDYTQLNPRQLR